MTLVVGLVCSDGLVIAADSEQSNDYTKSRVDKLLSHEINGTTCCIAGAGDGDFVDAAIQRVFDGIDEENPSDQECAFGAIRKALIDYYNNEMAAYPTDQESEKVIHLVIGVRSPDSELSLLKSTGPSLKRVSNYVIAGTGSLLIHVLEPLYNKNSTILTGIALSLHLLNIGKRFIAGVGGESHIATLEASGRFIPEPFLRIKEASLNAFNEAVGKLMLAFPDASIHPSDFSGKVIAFQKKVEELRSKQTEDVSKAALDDALHNPDHASWPRQLVPMGTIVGSDGQVIVPRPKEKQSPQ